jgi:hypothetical protein
MSATIIWDSTGPPEEEVGVAPRGQKPRGARGEKHHADRQTSDVTIGRNRSPRQHPRIWPMLVVVGYPQRERAGWNTFGRRCTRGGG